MSCTPLDGYTLIVTEKPDAAKRIASALDKNGKAKRALANGVPYYEAYRSGRIVVVPALGHLYTVSAAAREKGRKRYPIYDYEWVPRYKAEKKASRIKVWLQTITQLSKGADVFVDACDYDIEGSIIGYCILKYACGGREKEAKRMKYSTLTTEELEKAYASLLPHLDFALVEAGLARHEVDWLYGINLSRALTTATKNYSKQYATLSTGRVQGPTLQFLVAQEKRIASFEPTPYWLIKAKIQIGEELFEAEHEKGTIQSKDEAEAIMFNCKGRARKGKIEHVENEEHTQMPPPPFDLGALQTEAYRLFRCTPMRTSSITQRLYLDALISYPRTSSQKLPSSIGYQKILENLARNPEFTRHAEELLSKDHLKPTEGKKFDPAHPAIYPTGKLPQKKLVGLERNVYNLIVKRFLAVFGEPALRQTVKVVVNLQGEKFLLNGRRTLKEGWIHFYEGYARIKDTPLPPVNEGQEVAVRKVALTDKFTQPPPRYDYGSLLRKMEQCNIGTKATRAGITQTLYDRKYVQGEKMVVTDLGSQVTDVLSKFCPSVVSAEFTRRLEEKMSLVQSGQETKQKIIAEAIEILEPVMASLEENERAVGEQLSGAIQQANLEERIVGACPTCQDGKVIIQHSKKTGKRFVGCTNYFNGTCKTAFPLPQSGYVKPSDKTCRSCGWSTVLVWLKRKRPWNLCLNPQCPTKTKKKTAKKKKTLTK
ncbi:MAG: DNA topoisomerase I [Candidatus Bathyarchaeota archaeon]|nr:DNA topoisomerase I [Candidatus Bathyarchaeota archaeon]